jgi:hypothetical protein
MQTFAVLVGLALASAYLSAQQPAPPPPATPRAAAPLDLTGVWVSVVTEDWKWRMTTPSKGDTLGIPVNVQAQKIADSWDYAKDMAAGNECKAYGAGGIMRMPTRLRISWQDDSTLKLETDAGQQTKLLHFDKSRQAAGPRTLQGHSIAEWVDVPGARGGRGGAAAGRGGAAAGRGAPLPYGTGGLRVVSTNLREGYLRKNGVPYSQNAVVTEYIDRFDVPGAGRWIVVKTIVDDPTFLAGPYITSAHFMSEPDSSKWSPGPCQIDPPLVPTRDGVR